MKKYKILWASRHLPTKEQENELRRLFGKVDVIVYRGTVGTAEEVRELMVSHKCDDLLVVGTPEMIGEVTRMGYFPLKSVFGIRETRKDGTAYSDFIGFSRYVLPFNAKTEMVEPRRDDG